jgi:hypothetical protein
MANFWRRHPYRVIEIKNCPLRWLNSQVGISASDYFISQNPNLDANIVEKILKSQFLLGGGVLENLIKNQSCPEDLLYPFISSSQGKTLKAFVARIKEPIAKEEAVNRLYNSSKDMASRVLVAKHTIDPILANALCSDLSKTVRSAAMKNQHSSPQNKAIALSKGSTGNK